MSNVLKVTDGPAQVAHDAVDVPTVCVLCSHTCSLRVDVKDNAIVAVRGDETNPNTRGYTCNKARAIPNYVRHAQRVEHPLKRKPDGSFERIGWDQAIGEIALKLKRIHQENAPRSIALVGIGGQGNHMAGFGSLPFMFSLNSPMFFNALGQEKTQHALVWRRLYRATPDVYLQAEEELSDYMLLLGTNPVISNRGRNATEVFKQLEANPQRKLVVVDPRVSETARRADRHIRVKPGCDVYLLMGLVAIILREQLHDDAFVKRYVKDFDKLATSFQDIDPAIMAERAGIPVDDLLITAREFAQSPSACIYFDLGVEHIPHSTLVSYLINVLLLITGNAGIEKGNIFIQQFGPKLMFIEKQVRALVSGIEAIPMFLPTGILPPSVIPEEITTTHPDRIRALFVDGANPLLSYADTKAFREAFAKLELLVVIEPAMTETAMIADYVLPTPSILHKLARTARHPIGAPVFIAMTAVLAALRGGGIYPIAGRITNWMYETLGATLPAPPLSLLWLMSHGYALTRRAELNAAVPEARSLKNPFAAGELVFNKLLAHPEGVLLGQSPSLGNFARHCHHQDGKAHIFQSDWIADIRILVNKPPKQNADYPFILNGGLRTGWTANTIVRDPAWRKGKGPHCPIILNPEDAIGLGIREGDLVRLESKRGAVEGPAKLEPGTARGHLSIPNGFGMRFPDPVTGELMQVGILINELQDIQDRDPYTGCPHTKAIACRVMRVDPAQAQAA
jgi:anaerobic selenocysteine-containing dehydrogenase